MFVEKAVAVDEVADSDVGSVRSKLKRDGLLELVRL